MARKALLQVIIVSAVLLQTFGAPVAPSAFGASLLKNSNGYIERWCTDKNDSNGAANIHFLVHNTSIPWWSYLAKGVKKAMELWNATIAPIHFSYEFTDVVSGGYKLDDGISSIAWIHPLVTGYTNPGLAFIEANPDNGCIISADVVISSTYPFTSSVYKAFNSIYNTKGKRSLITLVSHELGHVLGFQHSLDYSIMGYDAFLVSTNGSIAYPFIDSDTISGAAAIYGVKTGYLKEVTDFAVSHFKHDLSESAKDGEYGHAEWTRVYNANGDPLPTIKIDATTGKGIFSGSSNKAQPASIVYPGQDVNLEITIGTSTTKYYSVSAPLQIYYSHDSNINRYDQQLSTFAVNCKNQACQSTDYFPITIPVTALTGEDKNAKSNIRYIGAVVNPDRVFGTDLSNTVKESNLKNNSTYVPVAISSPPVFVHFTPLDPVATASSKLVPHGGTIELPAYKNGEGVPTKLRLDFSIQQNKLPLPFDTNWKVLIAYPSQGDITVLERHTDKGNLSVLLPKVSIARGLIGGDKIIVRFESHGFSFGYLINLKNQEQAPIYTVSQPHYVKAYMDILGKAQNGVLVRIHYTAQAGGALNDSDVNCSVVFQTSKDPYSFSTIVNEVATKTVSAGSFVSAQSEEIVLEEGVYYAGAKTNCLGFESARTQAPKAIHLNLKGLGDYPKPLHPIDLP